MHFARPARLRRGDTIAVLSPSRGLASKFPHVYELGIRNLQETFGLKIKEYPSAKADADFLYNNPKSRAEDVNRAFEDPDVKAIIPTIGGDESIRILPLIDREVVKANPKILMGYSDISTILMYCNQLGLVTFHGPSVMAGFSQMKSLPTSFVEHVRDILFDPKPGYQYKHYEAYSDGYPDWSEKENLGRVRELRRNSGWNWLQGESRWQGELFGGNIEVLDWLKGTVYWPQTDFWDERILFLETSEEKPPPVYVERSLRNYGVQGIFEKINGLMIGRARDYSDTEKMRLDSTVVQVVSNEFGRTDLPILTNMDFGHTDPQFILPLGVRAEIDCEAKSLRLLDAPLS